MPKLRWSTVGALLALLSFFSALAIQALYIVTPCPMCILQRIAMLTSIVFFVISIKANNKLFSLLAIIPPLAGAGLAIRHWYIQSHKDEFSGGCGVGLDYMWDNFPLSKVLSFMFKGTGDCASIDWSFIGITLPQLALMSFSILILIAILDIANKLKK